MTRNAFQNLRTPATGIEMIAIVNDTIVTPIELIAHFLGIARHDNINAAPTGRAAAHNLQLHDADLPFDPH